MANDSCRNIKKNIKMLQQEHTKKLNIRFLDEYT